MTALEIRVLCVDDHPLMREGITTMVDRQKGMTVIASASTGEEAVELFRRHRPDVTLMDLQLPRMSGLDAIRVICKEDTTARVIVLTMHEGSEDIFQALKAGASTYLLKDMLAADLPRIVREVHSGLHPMVAEVAQRLSERAGEPTLTTRESETLQLIARGLRNKEIAADLGISEETVKVHIKNVFGKLQVRDRTAAVSAALQRGIIHVG